MIAALFHNDFNIYPAVQTKTRISRTASHHTVCDVPFYTKRSGEHLNLSRLARSDCSLGLSLATPLTFNSGPRHLTDSPRMFLPLWVCISLFSPVHAANRCGVVGVLELRILLLHQPSPSEDDIHRGVSPELIIVRAVVVEPLVATEPLMLNDVFVCGLSSIAK